MHTAPATAAAAKTTTGDDYYNDEHQSLLPFQFRKSRTTTEDPSNTNTLFIKKWIRRYLINLTLKMSVLRTVECR